MPHLELMGEGDILADAGSAHSTSRVSTTTITTIIEIATAATITIATDRNRKSATATPRLEAWAAIDEIDDDATDQPTYSHIRRSHTARGQGEGKAQCQREMP